MNLNAFQDTGCHYKSLAGAQKPPFSCRLFHQCVASLFPLGRGVFQQVAYPVIITLHPSIPPSLPPTTSTAALLAAQASLGWKVNKWKRQPHGYELVKSGFRTIWLSVFQTVCLNVWKRQKKRLFCLQSDCTPGIAIKLCPLPLKHPSATLDNQYNKKNIQ